MVSQKTFLLQKQSLYGSTSGATDKKIHIKLIESKINEKCSKQFNDFFVNCFYFKYYIQQNK